MRAAVVRALIATMVVVARPAAAEPDATHAATPLRPVEPEPQPEPDRQPDAQGEGSRQDAKDATQREQAGASPDEAATTSSPSHDADSPGSSRPTGSIRMGLPTVLPTNEVSGTRRALAIAAAVFPGVLAHGLGSHLVHERRAAKRLFVTGAIGFGAMFVGGLPVGISGGNPYTIVPGVPILLGGAGLFLSSWMSDLWVAAGGKRLETAPRAETPWSVEAGGVWLHRALRDRVLAQAAGRIVIGRVDVGGEGWFDARGEALEGLVEARVRILGARETGAVIADGSRLHLRVGARMRRDDEEEVDSITGEVELCGRLDLLRFARALDGTFLELSTGLGAERVTYANDGTDIGSLLLGRFAWGAYLGRRGEATLFYDHRRDLLAGGIAAGRAAGFVGSAGGNVELRVVGPWAVRGELEVGSAWVSTLAVRYQGGRW